MQTDPSGDYGADEVTVTVSGEVITKGPGGTGRFVHIGQNGTHPESTTGTDGSVTLSVVHDLRRPLTIRLLKSSPGNAVLSRLSSEAKVSVRIERRPGGDVMNSDGWIEGEPREVSSDEREWSLIVMA